MSFPAYPEYNDSGVEWLGKVPAEWKIVQTKRLFRRRKETNAGMKCEDCLALTMNGVIPRQLDDLDGLQSSDYEGYQIFEQGDLAFKLIDLQNIKTSRVGMVPSRGIMSPAYVRLQPTAATVGRFGFWYFMALYWLQVFNQLGGGVRQTLSPEDLLVVPFPKPSKHEMTSIAAFLDRETAKIDAAVAAQERLIALLAEKRAATISHAVTKGLYPDAPMQDSGIEWLGQIPAHWSVQKIGWKLKAKPRYGVLVPDDDPVGVPMLRIKDLTAEVTDTDSLLTISAELSDQYPNTVVEVGDLLLSVVGTIGSTRIVGPELAGVNLSRAIARLRPSNTVYTPYLRWIFESLPFTQYVDLTCVGTAQRVLNMDDLSALHFAFPTIEEQQKISEELDRAVGRFDDLINRARAAMELLKERRAALISDAVTGKIDVRGEVETQEQEAA